MGKYFDELKRAMEFLDSIPNSVFLGLVSLSDE